MLNGLIYEAVSGWEKLPEGYAHRDVCGVTVDSRDRLYMLTRGDQRVIVYERDGTFVTSWGDNTFTSRIHGKAVGPDDSVYTADDGDHTVRKFTADGRQLFVFGTPDVASDTGYDDFFKGKTETFSVTRFLLALRQHIPPRGSQYIRRYGLYASRTKGKPKVPARAGLKCRLCCGSLQRGGRPSICRLLSRYTLTMKNQLFLIKKAGLSGPGSSLRCRRSIRWPAADVVRRCEFLP